MPLYPVRALERAMKISEVITRAISGKINWIQAAEILGMSDRQLRRWGAWKLGEVRLPRTIRPSNPATQSETSAAGGCGEGVEMVSGEIRRPEREALRGEAARGGTHFTELHMG